MKMTRGGIAPCFRNTLVLLSFAFFAALAPSAHAHAHLVKSTPVKDAELSAAPAQIDLWFNELLEEGFNTIQVYPYAELDNAKPSNHIEGKVMVDAKDHTHLLVKLGSLAPGKWVVDWLVLSRDGHSAPGRITFIIKGAK